MDKIKNFKQKQNLHHLPNKLLKILLLIIGSLIFLYLVTIPWRAYVCRKNLEQGENLLVERKYTEAFVHFQKAEMLEPGDWKSKQRLELSKKAAKDILELRLLLKEKNQDELTQIISDADSKVCNLEADRVLIDKGLTQVALVNLKFCTSDGPKNYDSWLFLGITNQKLSGDNYIFKELKPDYRAEAKRAFEEAYKVDPIAKTAPEYLIELYKTDNNSEKVDYWQHLLDNLNKIEK